MSIYDTLVIIGLKNHSERMLNLILETRRFKTIKVFHPDKNKLPTSLDCNTNIKYTSDEKEIYKHFVFDHQH